jgi:hypothetical protein
MTQRNFDLARRKGGVGESVVRGVLEAKGWVVYQPVTEGAHQFDMLCIKDKRSAAAFDIKAKARMNKFPCTGVDQRHFEEYKSFAEKHNMPFWLVFVDESMRSIYGNTIAELETPRSEGGIDYPWAMKTKGGKFLRLWPLSAMKVIADLSVADADALKALSQRSYDYGVHA